MGKPKTTNAQRIDAVNVLPKPVDEFGFIYITRFIGCKALLNRS